MNAKKTLQNLLTIKLGIDIMVTIKLGKEDLVMRKEDVLEKSRSENKRMDEFELAVIASAGKLAAKVGMTVCCLVSVLQVIFIGTINYESWTIYFSILGTISIVKYVKLRQKIELAMSIVYSVIFIFFTVLFITRLVG